MPKVLITGGAGFLGRGILRQVASGLSDWEVTVYSRDEEKQDRCRKRFPFARYLLGDILDYDRLQAALVGHDIVIHGAAVKFVPEAELNPGEAVRVNVDGSRNVIKAAKAASVQKVVAISTDKACLPVNLYGAGKMIMERLFAEALQYEGDTRFTCVRYGNVIGSTGSVIPLFQRQFEETGKVRITSERMTRFWMSVDDAVRLIVLALSPGVRSGAIIIPYAGGMRLSDVARAATLDDVSIEIIGERPGEKLNEMLVHYEESVRIVSHLDNEFPYFELLPPGNLVGESAFTMTSSCPPHWLTVEEMRTMIEDSKEV